ncbi:hypothetical protein RCF27_16925 [Rhodococcus pyridinivorans]|nr:hypothetical protein [Rhodococcus pyridinivorans]WMM75255.1 hypothetical protein RCF27_16925 [Rhodococcus pyridinivorans]
MSGDGTVRGSEAGTPQGGIFSPLLANIARTVLDAHFCAKWDAHGSSYGREVHRKRGGATYHLDEGVDFLGFRIQRRRRKGTNKMSVYTYPSKKALLSIMAKARALTKKHVIMVWLICSGVSIRCFEDGVRISTRGVSKATFAYFDAFAWHRAPDGCSNCTNGSRGRISTDGS